MDAHARLRVEESELTRAHGEEARHRCAPLGQILQTILAFAPIFFPREKDGEDTRAKGREKMNLRSKLTRRSYSSRTSFLGYVRGKDYHYVGRIDSFRFSPSSPGVGHIVEEKSTSSMRHRWCSRLYVTCIRTVGAYPTSLEGVAIIIKLPPIVPNPLSTHSPLLPSSPVSDSGHRLSRSKSIEVGTEKSLDDCFI